MRIVLAIAFIVVYVVVQLVTIFWNKPPDFRSR